MTDSLIGSALEHASITMSIASMPVIPIFKAVELPVITISSG